MQNITTFNFLELDKFSKIFVLISGGIDSTYLYEAIYNLFPSKTIAVNCFNPYENSTTLNIFRQKDNFIEIKASKEIDYLAVLKESFMKIPESFKMKTYSKKVFNCCRIIKHSAFLENPLFKKSNSVVISGIKYSDGFQRRLWLTSLFTGKTTSKGTIILNAPTFYHKHKGGQLYCYPFRDFKHRELPIDIIAELKVKYPNLTHSGCSLCPVLVRFEKRIRKDCIKNNDIETLKRLNNSIEFAKKLKIYEDRG